MLSSFDRLVPALAILAACYGPLASGRHAYSILLVVAALALKTATPGAPWGISFQRGSSVAMAPLLSSYSERGRGNELVLVDADDELYASVLPLPKVRYAYVGECAPPRGYGLGFAAMGIILTAGQYGDLRRWEAVFRERLRGWGLDSSEPIGTVVLASAPAELAGMVAAHPETDFLVPERFYAAVAHTAAFTHDLVTVSPDRFFLLSRRALPAPPRRWTSRL